jgi:beta-glucanase (GH16 family)
MNPLIDIKRKRNGRLLRIVQYVLLALPLAFPAWCQADWQLAWSDEFTQADGSSPDSTKWGFDIGGGGYGNNELESYTSRTNNVRIQGGQLVIEAKQENFTGTDNIPRNYTSARMLTRGKWSWTYGRMEARIKIPRGQGIWPAFWMLGANISTTPWPNCGEIDIMENIGKTSEQSKVYGTIHGPQSGGDYNGGAGVGGSYTLPGGAILGDDFHVFAIEWTTNQIKWFMDNQQYFTATPASLPGGGTWPFTQPQFFLLNVAVGGNWPGNPDGTTVFPQQMLVDYVRVYNYVAAAPDAPTGLSASPGNAKVYLSWDASTSGATAYNIKRATISGGSYITVGNSNTNSFTDTGAANCTTYYYVVTATNSLGESTNSSEKTAALGAFALAVNSGGNAAGQFVADANVAGGTVAAPTSSFIDTSGVTNPAPQAVYQTERYGTFTYTFGGLTLGGSYKVRLHFVEYYWNNATARAFNVTINGTQVLTNYDIFAAAGGKNKAIIREFTSTPNGSGQIVIAYTVGTADQPKSSGIEILLPQTPTPVAGNNGPVSTGMTLNLMASSVPGATYSWTGPNGFNSTNQNPSIVNASSNVSGLFSVTATTGGCASAPGTTIATVGPPAQVTVQSSAGNIVLSWLSGTLQTATNVSGPWADVIGAASPRTNPAAGSQQFYRLKLQ